MPKHQDQGVTAQWETDWLELPDNDLTRASFVLIPTYFFGDAFRVSAIEVSPSIDPCAGVPARVKVTATTTRKLYTVLIRFQQGAESFGDDPPPFALIELKGRQLTSKQGEHSELARFSLSDEGKYGIIVLFA